MSFPELVFLVPYRDRKTQKFFFSKHMEYILENENYEVYFCHQHDNRPFNRGAIKNIGFLAMKEKYPEHYKKITFIFHDIDTLPFDKILDYKTKLGVVKHFYGFEHSLGGIFSIIGEDFESTLGFPTLWGWGMEDTIMQHRCLSSHLIIDRKQFYKIGSPEILHLFDGIQRIINPSEQKKMGNNIHNLNMMNLDNIIYTIDNESSNHVDNVFTTNNSRIFYINIKNFITINKIIDHFYKYDLRHPIKKISNPNTSNIVYSQGAVSDWTDIPYYPTKEERKMVRFQEEFPKRQVPLFSQEYAVVNKIKPRATTSARIGLGGII